MPPLTPFDFRPRTRIVFGDGVVDRVGDLAREHQARRVLLVTDPGIVAAGHADHLRRVLEAAQLTVTVYDQVRENPTTRDVASCLKAAQTTRIDSIVGLGGGSSLDTAKGCNFLLTNGGKMSDYRGVGKATKPMLPFIAVPTTAGTGSECQSFALIADDQTHQKMACGDAKAAARVAVLDPTLTLTQPRNVTACTGLDAVAHAVETSVTLGRNPVSLLFAHGAFRLTHTSLPCVLDAPDDLQRRGRMQLGAAWAGIAIENSMLGAAHSAANPLTAHHDIVHGQAVGMMLTHVVRYNAQDDATRRAYVDLAQRSGLCPQDRDDPVEDLIECLSVLLAAARLPANLAECGVPSSAIDELAEEAAGQWTARFNPRPIGTEDFARLYRDAMGEQEATKRPSDEGTNGPSRAPSRLKRE